MKKSLREPCTNVLICIAERSKQRLHFLFPEDRVRRVEEH